MNGRRGGSYFFQYKIDWNQLSYYLLNPSPLMGKVPEGRMGRVVYYYSLEILSIALITFSLLLNALILI